MVSNHRIGIEIIFAFCLFTIIPITARESLFGQSVSKNPHGEIKFDCTLCHTTDSWIELSKDMKFDHSKTDFALIGRHAGLDCRQCHTSLEFSQEGNECSDCHEDIHQDEIGNDCERCHEPMSWFPAKILIKHQETRFPLTGVHFITDCTSCHVNQQEGEFAGTPIECISCHNNEYLNTQEPNHVSGGFSTNCDECHSTNAWQPANSNHVLFGFPLEGVHLRIECTACHTNNQFKLAATECEDCHISEYNGATNPNHIASGFPTDCKQCHTSQPGWRANGFNHDRFFPIYSGAHRGKWDDCSTCHISEGNFEVFSCLVCHEHSQERMDRGHRGRRNYVYESSACYDCHPGGVGDD